MLRQEGGKGNSACGQKEAGPCGTLAHTVAGLLAAKGNRGGTTELPASACHGAG
ncbi:MAG: hypothetical protein ABIN94_12555 [Ferruginibacter sp.]